MNNRSGRQPAGQQRIQLVVMSGADPFRDTSAQTVETIIAMEGADASCAFLAGLSFPPGVAIERSPTGWQLRTSLLTNGGPHGSLSGQAAALVARLNAVGALHSLTFQALTVGNISHPADQGILTVHAVLDMTVHYREPYSFTDIAQHPPVPSPAGLQAALTGERLRQAFQFFSIEPRDWTTLYKVYEIIRDSTGGHKTIEKRGWATADELKRFRATANNPLLGGSTARHAKGADARIPAMSLPDGEDLIRALLIQWIADHT